ncbi:hypothetical protein [Halalkalicoccus salilacus]|uniref:hypothetical protein n=1 Tax=Halalkalicoccus TaxID=332246 RepID=UPI002F96D7D7
MSLSDADDRGRDRGQRIRITVATGPFVWSPCEDCGGRRRPRGDRIECVECRAGWPMDHIDRLAVNRRLANPLRIKVRGDE